MLLLSRWCPEYYSSANFRAIYPLLAVMDAVARHYSDNSGMVIPCNPPGAGTTGAITAGATGAVGTGAAISPSSGSVTPCNCSVAGAAGSTGATGAGAAISRSSGSGISGNCFGAGAMGSTGAIGAGAAISPSSGMVTLCNPPGAGAVGSTGVTGTIGATGAGAAISPSSGRVTPCNPPGAGAVGATGAIGAGGAISPSSGSVTPCNCSVAGAAGSTGATSAGAAPALPFSSGSGGRESVSSGAISELSKLAFLAGGMVVLLSRAAFPGRFGTTRGGRSSPSCSSACAGWRSPKSRPGISTSPSAAVTAAQERIKVLNASSAHLCASPRRLCFNNLSAPLSLRERPHNIAETSARCRFCRTVPSGGIISGYSRYSRARADFSRRQVNAPLSTPAKSA